MSYHCEVKELPVIPTLTIRTRTSVQELPKTMHKAYGAIAHYLGEMGEQIESPAYAAYYNMDMQNLDVEIGFPVSDDLPGRNDVKPSKIPAGKYVSCVFTGPYSDIEPAYNALTKEIKENGYEVTRIAYELYLNDPDVIPPNELKTEILFPIK
ncbi:GyrI-like domain-containing protein [Thermoproteota archaeon]